MVWKQEGREVLKKKSSASSVLSMWLKYWCTRFEQSEYSVGVDEDTGKKGGVYSQLVQFEYEGW